jgi:hypothetical protein
MISGLRYHVWTSRLASVCALLLFATGGTLAAAEKSLVAVVIGPSAGELERYGADELCRYLNKLFDIQVQPAVAPTSGAEFALLIGSPETNPAVARALGAEGWPKVSDQGIVLKHTKLDGQAALVIGGGSPRATLWAVYELVERWGVQYLLHGDVLPEKPGKFQLPEADVLLEPKFVVRQWRVINDLADGPESWGINDYKPLLDQLAKLKFNRLLVSIYPWQPFLDLKQGNIERKQAWLWYDLHYPITDDMPGRQLFGKQTEWWNPDLPRGADYRTFVDAGIRHVRTLIAYAKSRGFEIGISVSIAEFPKEFAPLLKDYRAIYSSLGNLTVTPGPLQPVDDPNLWELSTNVIQTTLNTYPEVDFVMPYLSESPAWGEAYHNAWQALDAKYDLESRFPVQSLIDSARNRRGYAGGPDMAEMEVKSAIAGLYLIDKLISERKVFAKTKRPDVFVVFDSAAEELTPLLPYVLPKGSETLNQLDYTPERIVARPDAFRHISHDGMRNSLVFTLHDDNVGMLPASNNDSLAILAGHMRDNGWAGFSTRYWLLSDHDPCVAFLARRSWDDEATPEKVYRDQFEATCGAAAADDLLAMFGELEVVTRDMNQHGMGLVPALPSGSIDRKHWVPDPLPAQLLADQEHYRRALESASKAHEKSTQRGKPYTAYWVGRLKFGVGYFDCAAAARRLAQAKVELEKAKPSGDAVLIAQKRRAALARAEAAVQAARDTIEAFVRVARDQSDRGTVAVMAENLYRPLKKEAEALQ